MHTTRWLPLGLVLGCLTARADMANPVMRSIHPQVAFLGGQDHPDHVFLVYVRDVGHWSIQQFESCVTPILGPEPLWLDFGRTDDKFSVIAVPKAAFERLSEEQRKALSPESPGALSCGVAVLAVLLSPRHGWRVRLFAGVWLSACTLPVVWLALPDALPVTLGRAAVVAVAEVFAPLAECGLFWWAFIRPRPPDRRATVRDLVAIVAANLASFVTGEAVWLLLSLH